MYTYIEERVLLAAEYIAQSGATVRAAAKKFGVSKSTVHKDMTGKLPFLNPTLAREVSAIMKKNKDERHIRGGMATCMKYKNQKNSG